MDKSNDPAAGSWHIDKRINIALILAIIGQTFGLGWWASSISERVAVLERSYEANRDDGERLAVLESQVGDIKLILQRIESTLRPTEGRGR